MNDRQKRRLKIRVKAGAAILLDSLVIYNFFGTAGTLKTVGLKNALREFNNSSYEFVVETGNDQLIEFVNALTTTKKIDMNDRANSIHELKNSPSLKYLEIYNSQRLDDETIKLINDLGLEEVRLIFNKQETLKKLGTGGRFNLNKFNDKSIIKDIRFSSNIVNDELDGFIFLNYLYGYDDIDIWFKEYKYLDDIVGSIVNDLDVNYIYPDDIMNLIKLVNIEREYIKYDPDIYRFTKANDYTEYEKKDIDLYNKMVKYNKESLSSILDTDKMEIADYKRQIKGICSNYQALFTALCIKTGIECYPITGTHISDDHIAGHGWNIICLNGIYYLVDVTRFDSFEECNKLMDKFMQTFDTEDYNILINQILYPLDSQIIDEYEPAEMAIGAIKEGTLIEPINAKNNIYGTKVPKDIYDKYGKFFLTIIMTVSVGYVLFTERERWLYKKNENEKKTK